MKNFSFLLFFVFTFAVTYQDIFFYEHFCWYLLADMLEENRQTLLHYNYYKWWNYYDYDQGRFLSKVTIVLNQLNTSFGIKVIWHSSPKLLVEIIKTRRIDNITKYPIRTYIQRIYNNISKYRIIRHIYKNSSFILFDNKKYSSQVSPGKEIKTLKPSDPQTQTRIFRIDFKLLVPSTLPYSEKWIDLTMNYLKDQKQHSNRRIFNQKWFPYSYVQLLMVSNQLEIYFHLLSFLLLFSGSVYMYFYTRLPQQCSYC